MVNSSNSIIKFDKPIFDIPKTNAGEITIITPENTTYTEGMSGYYPALYGFENDENGSDPAEWDVFEGAGYVNVKDSLGGHSKIIEMYDGTSGNHDELHKSFPLQTSGTVEFWLMSDDVSEAFSMRLLDDTATNVWGNGIGWVQIWENNIRYLDDTDWTDVKAISDNTWYHIKIEFECTSGNYQGLAQDTWRFYIDGQVYGDFNFLNDINNVTQLYCFTRGANSNYRVYTDAFGFSWNSNYDIGDNLNEGLLISFYNATTLDWIGYSLDGANNKTIIGNRTIPMPLNGSHYIQVFGNDSIGIMYQSSTRYFSVQLSPTINHSISIITPESIIYTEPMSGYYPALYGFENDEHGSDPAEWDVFEGAGYVNVRNSIGGHSKVIEFYDGTSGNHDELHKSFSSQTHGTVEFWVMSDDVSQTFSMRLLDSTATNVWGDGIGWVQIWESDIRFQDDIGWTDVKAISDNTWYHIKIEFECTTGNYMGLAQDTWRFYVDGDVYGDFNFLNNVDNINQIYCFTRGADNNYRCYTDAFGFSWDSNYNVGDNINEGLLLSFTNSTTLDWIGYSLDGNSNITILGNKVIPLPENGVHSIVVSGITSTGIAIKSDSRFFTVLTPEPPPPPIPPRNPMFIIITLISIGIGSVTLVGITIVFVRRKKPDRTEVPISSRRESQINVDGSDKLKVCPYCFGQIKISAKYCTLCGASLEKD